MKIVKYQLFFRFQHQQYCCKWARSTRTLVLVLTSFQQVKLKTFLLFYKRSHTRQEREKSDYDIFRQDDQVEEQISLTQEPAEETISSPEHQSSALLSPRSTEQQAYKKTSSVSGLYHSVLVTVFAKKFGTVFKSTSAQSYRSYLSVMKYFAARVMILLRSLQLDKICQYDVH